MRDDDVARRAVSSLLPPDVGRLALYEYRPSHDSVGSRTHDGRHVGVTAHPSFDVACDVEAIEPRVAGYLAEETGVSLLGFLEFWTLLECIAKLTATPAHLLFVQNRSDADRVRLEALHPAIRSRTVQMEDVVLTVAWRPR